MAPSNTAGSYPICLDLSGKRCVVAGGGYVAERKVIGLLAAGAVVAVVSPDLTPSLRQLRDDGRITHHEGRFLARHLSGAFLAIAATDDPQVNRSVSRAARRRRVLVNVADDASHSDFTLPAIVRRGDLQVAVSTNGRSPAVARRIRDDLESYFTSEHAALLDVAAGVRVELAAAGRRATGRQWHQALDGEVRTLLARGDHAAARDRLVAKLAMYVGDEPHNGLASSATSATRDTGTVALVGAGPGDPGLITVRGLQLLREADVVIYDRLIDPRLLAETRPEAELIYVGKVASRHTLRQNAIHELMVIKARQGRRVIRLKGGDPLVFGRGGEEAEALATANLKFEIVPGITSAIAVPAYAGIPLTQRDRSSSFAVITGHEDPAKPASTIRWDRLATAVDTLVCLMSAENLPKIVSQLVGHGRPVDTPVAVVRWGTWTEQETVVGTLADIVSKVAQRNIGSPAVAVIGETVRLREMLAWFPERKPAAGGLCAAS